MEKTPIDGLTIFFPAEERSAAELVRQACEKSISLIRTSWGLETPEDVRVYAHLKLPTWLNEGLAMVTAERFAGKPILRRDSLVLLEPPMAVRGSMSRQAAKSGGLEAVVALYAWGYWRTRYLEETRPGLLNDLFAQPVHPDHWENAIANACNTSTDAFWSMANTLVVDYFLEQAGAAQTAAALAGEGYNARGHFVEP